MVTQDGIGRSVVRLLLDRGADPKLMTLDDEDFVKVTPEIRKMLGR